MVFKAGDLEVDEKFDKDGDICFEIDSYSECLRQWLDRDQVENLILHLQNALNATP